MPILVLKGKRYEFDVDGFTAKEGIAVEKATGYTWQEFVDKASARDLLGTWALVWMVRRQHGEDVQFDDAGDFKLKDVSYELDDEQKRLIEQATAEPANPPGGDEPPSRGDGPAVSPTPRKSTGSSRRKSSVSTRSATSTT